MNRTQEKNLRLAILYIAIAVTAFLLSEIIVVISAFISQNFSVSQMMGLVMVTAYIVAAFSVHTSALSLVYILVAPRIKSKAFAIIFGIITRINAIIIVLFFVIPLIAVIFDPSFRTDLAEAEMTVALIASIAVVIINLASFVVSFFVKRVK